MSNPSKKFHLIALGQALIEHDLRAHPYPGLKPIADYLKNAEICFSNFEGAIQPNGATPTRDGILLHGASPRVLDCLKNFSINLLALSNNHAFDFGAVGIAETISQARARGLVCAGSGENLGAASAPAFLQGAIKTAALVAFASKIPDGSAATNDQPGVNALRLTPDKKLDSDDTRRILNAIQHAKQRADYVIAYHHDHYWEPNWQETPRWKIDWAHACIDAGASTYISHGAPLLHGIEIYKRHPIFYGLGNFIFHTKKPVGTYELTVWESVIVECAYRDGEFVALKLRAIVLNESGEAEENFFKTRGRPSFADDATAQKIFGRLQKLSKPFGTTLRIGSDFAEIEI